MCAAHRSWGRWTWLCCGIPGSSSPCAADSEPPMPGRGAKWWQVGTRRPCHLPGTQDSQGPETALLTPRQREPFFSSLSITRALYADGDWPHHTEDSTCCPAPALSRVGLCPHTPITPIARVHQLLGCLCLLLAAGLRRRAPAPTHQVGICLSSQNTLHFFL